MENEIKKQNKEIITKFEKAKAEIDDKIAMVNEYQGYLDISDKSELVNVGRMLNALENTKQSLEKQIEKFKEKDRNNQSIITKSTRSSKSLLSGASSELKEEYKSFDEQIALNNQEISKIEAASNMLKGDSKIVSATKKILESRIQSLKNKNGKMSLKQCKLADKIVAEKLKSRTAKISKYDDKLKVIEKMNTNFEKKEKAAEEIKKIENNNKAYTEAKEMLKDTGFLGNIASKGISFVEKLDANKIERLKNKQGILLNKNKTIFIKSTSPSLIERMKNKVSFFKNRVNAAVEAYKNYSNPTVAHAARKKILDYQ